MLKEQIMLSIASFKAAEMWMHAAHHLTKGPSFIATHEMLYGRIYETFSEDFDKLVEKMIFTFDDEELGCPIHISKNAALILSEYESPANLDERSISMLAFVLIVDHMKGVESLLEVLKQNNVSSLGIEDFLSAAYSQYETYAYMLNQHVKI